MPVATAVDSQSNYSSITGSSALMTDPPRNAAPVTPSDGADLSNVTRGIFVGVAGNIQVTMAGIGTAILFSNVPVGILPIRVSRIWATNTTAASLVAIW